MNNGIKIGDPVWEFELDWEDHQFPVFRMQKISEIKDIGKQTVRVGAEFPTRAIELSKFRDEEQCKEELLVNGYSSKHYATSPAAGKAVCRLALASMRRMRMDELDRAQKLFEAGLKPVEGFERQEKL